MTVAKTNGTTSPMATDVSTEKEKQIEHNKLQFGGEDDEDQITLEDLAPDGGWGWMVALAMVLVFITAFGPGASFALIFGDFLEETGQAGTATTMFNSAFMITFSVSGLMTNTLIRRYGIRSVGLAGAIVFAIPNLCFAFVTNVYEMAFISMLQGLGLGFILTVCNTNFNAYFVKKRAQVMSAAQVIVGLGLIVYPICIERMMNVYGFRGTAALTGAMSLNVIVGMAMMHPLEWHARNPEEVRAERALKREERKLQGMAISNRRSTIDVVHFSHKTKWTSSRSLREETGKEVPLLIEMHKTPASRVASISEIEGGTRGGTRSVSAREALSRRMSALSASSLTNLVSGNGLGDWKQMQKNIELRGKKGTKSLVKEPEKNNSEREGDILAELFDMSLIKNGRFINMCLGMSFIFTGDYIFCVLLPLMMTDNGYTKSDAALAVTVSAAAELIARVLLAIFTLVIDVKAKYIFFGAMIVMAFAKVAFLLYEKTLMGALVAVAAIGLVRSWLIVPQPLIVVEGLPIQKFASANGLFVVISGIISIVCSPIVGVVKDATNSFLVCQLCLLAMSALFIVPWATQFIVDFWKGRKEQEEQEEQKAQKERKERKERKDKVPVRNNSISTD